MYVKHMWKETYDLWKETYDLWKETQNLDLNVWLSTDWHRKIHLQKRPMYVEKVLHMWKETYDLWKETYNLDLYVWLPTDWHMEKIYTHKRDQCM